MIDAARFDRRQDMRRACGDPDDAMAEDRHRRSAVQNVAAELLESSAGLARHAGRANYRREAGTARVHATRCGGMAEFNRHRLGSHHRRLPS